MTSKDFCFWLQGMFELANPQALNKAQTELIRRHLHIVFEHEIGPELKKSKPRLEMIHDESPAKSISGTSIKKLLEKFPWSRKGIAQRSILDHQPLC